MSPLGEDYRRPHSSGRHRAGASSVDGRSVGSPDHFCREERGGVRGTPQWLLNEGGTPLGPGSVTPQTPPQLEREQGENPLLIYGPQLWLEVLLPPSALPVEGLLEWGVSAGFQMGLVERDLPRG